MGAALIEHVKDWAEARGLGKVYWVTGEDNTVAQRLYDRVATRNGSIQYELRL